MGKDKGPDHVSHDSYGRVPFTGDLGGEVHKTTIEKDGEEYKGYGSSREEADKEAAKEYEKRHG